MDGYKQACRNNNDHYQTMAGTVLAHRRFFIDRASLSPISRLALGLWQLERVDAVAGWQEMLLQGLRVDFATLCWLWGCPPCSPCCWPAPCRGPCLAAAHPGLADPGALAAALPGDLHPLLRDRVRVRPNRLYIEYLIYPKEVFAMLWAGRKGELLLALLFSGAVLAGGWWLSGRLLRGISFPRWYWRPAFALLILAIGFLGARSSLGHRPSTRPWWRLPAIR